MKASEILALFDDLQRINIEYPRTRREQRPHVVRYVSETGGQHFILHSDLEGADIDAVIAEEQAYFGPLGAVEWKVYEHDRPPDLRQRLAAHGFEVEEPEAVMALDLQQTPQWPAMLPGEGGTPHPGAKSRPGRVTVRRLDDPGQLNDVQEIEEIVWQEEMDWVHSYLGPDMAIPGYLSVYVAYVDEQPACAGWIYFYPNGVFADLWGGSTVSEHRGRGLYTAVLGQRLKEAADRGYRFVTVDASPMSRPIVAKHGFQLLTRAWGCKWQGETR